MPDGQWAVDLPAEEVPPEMPEPSLGYASHACSCSTSRFSTVCTVLRSCGYRCLQDQLQSGRYAGDLRLYILKSNSVRQLDFCLTFFHSCWKLPILIALVQSVVQRRDWLMLVAVHSDTWLYAVAFYNGARLDKNGRYGTAQKCERLPFRAPTLILTGRVIVGRNFLT